MSDKKKQRKPRRECKTKNVDVFFKARGSKTILVCQKKKPNKITDSKNHSDVISFEIKTEWESLKIELRPDQIRDLVSDCLIIINNKSLTSEDACRLLARAYEPRPRTMVDWWLNSMDEESDDIEFRNLRDAFRFNRQMEYLTSNLHESTEPIQVHLAAIMDSKVRDEHFYAINRSLIISYMPCYEHKQNAKETIIVLENGYFKSDPVQTDKERVNQPWRIHITEFEVQGDECGGIISDFEVGKSLDISLSHEHFIKFLSCICEKTGIPIPEFSNLLHE